jgi:hypothetical protein
MDNIVFAVWVSARLEFGAEEKRAGFHIAKKIVTLALKVRKKGLLSVEDEIVATHNAFLKTALQLAVDGAEPEQIREAMQNWIIFGNFQGEKLLRRLIIIDGVLMIVKGENPKQINGILASFFGEDLLQEYKKFVEWQKLHDSVYPPFLMEDFWYNIKDKQMHRAQGSNLLENVLRGFDDFTLQCIIKNSNEHDLLIAAKGSSEYVLQRIINNISHETAQDFIDTIYYDIKNLRLIDTISAQNRIIAQIKELEDHGIISVSDKSTR